MSKLFESYLAGQLAGLLRVRAHVLADDQQLQAPGRRLLGAGQADLGPGQPHGELPRHRRQRPSRPGWRRAVRAPTSTPTSPPPPASPPDCTASRSASSSRAEPIHGTNVGAENVPRAPRTLIETTRTFRNSQLARDWFGDDFVEHFAATREWEWRQWLDAVTDWELKRYFEII